MINSILKFRKSKKKRLLAKLKLFMFVFFLLGVNSFAWFVFVTEVNNDITADVIGWDVIFLDENNEQIKDVNLSIDTMYPGMPDYIDTYSVKNNSDVHARFGYEINSLNLLGKEVLINENLTSEELASILENDLPFHVIIDTEADTLAIDETISYSISVVWDYESVDEYYQLNFLYDYNENYKYYVLNGLVYEEAEVTELNFESLVTSGLYLKSDDADTYWGEKAVLYKSEHANAECINLAVNLKISQDNSTE